MQKNQQGFAALGAIILLVVVVAVVGGGYYVLKSQDKSTSSSESIVEPLSKKASIPANGTPENASKAVVQQLQTEIKIEDDGASLEAKESELSATTLNGVTEAVDASKL